MADGRRGRRMEAVEKGFSGGLRSVVSSRPILADNVEGGPFLRLQSEGVPTTNRMSRAAWPPRV